MEIFYNKIKRRRTYDVLAIIISLFHNIILFATGLIAIIIGFAFMNINPNIGFIIYIIYSVCGLILIILGIGHQIKWMIKDHKYPAHCSHCGQEVEAERTKYSKISLEWDPAADWHVLQDYVWRNIYRPRLWYKCPSCEHEEYICPYCYEPMKKEDDKCPHCGKRILKDD